MKFNYLAIIVLLVFPFIMFSQEKSLFPDEGQDFWENLVIKNNDSSLLKELLNENKLASSAYALPNLYQIMRQKQFLESENSATKNPMPLYKPKGNFKHKSIFPDNTMNYYLLREPVKER